MDNNEPNEKVLTALENIKNLTLMEASSLVKQMEITFGISTQISANVGVFDQGKSLTPIVEEVEEKTSFDITLTQVPAEKKIAILKIIRNVTGLGLKESKEIVDTVPKLVKEGASKEEVEKIKKEIEEAGGSVTIK